jgi:hypothetical protein
VSEPSASPEPTASPPGSTKTGPGRLLIAVYALFALAATARAGVQIATKFHHAPVAYLLSAFAGVVYILATVTFTVGSPTARRIALVSCSVELAGVLGVGTWSIVDPATFPDATVWSSYGSGYGFVPVVLPVFGLLWLRRWSGRASTGPPTVTSAADAGETVGSQGAEDVVADGATRRPEVPCPAETSEALRPLPAYDPDRRQLCRLAPRGPPNRPYPPRSPPYPLTQAGLPRPPASSAASSRSAAAVRATAAADGSWSMRADRLAPS